MDIVYLVKFGNWNPELKYSLRSLQNIPHRNVFMVGYTPEWVTNIVSVWVPSGKDRFYNTTKNIKAACKDKRISDDFVLMNDDFYINTPIDQVRPYHRGGLESMYLPSGEYQAQRNQAVDVLHELNIKHPLNYDLHIPMVINKRKMLDVLQLMKDRGHSHKRSVYGNIVRHGGDFMEDVKIHGFDDTFSAEQQFISSNKDAVMHGPLGKYLKEKFNKKSVYEV